MTRYRYEPQYDLVTYAGVLADFVAAVAAQWPRTRGGYGPTPKVFGTDDGLPVYVVLEDGMVLTVGNGYSLRADPTATAFDVVLMGSDCLLRF